MLLRHIRYFLAVAEHRNFTRAAEALHVSQPTLSQQIRQLEDTLRVQLLDRSGRTIQLTDAGAAYVRYAQRALQDLDAGERAIHDVQELSRGALRLAMTPTFTAYLIGPLLAKYNRRYSNITLNILEMPQDRMEALLNEDALDVGIAFTDTHSPDIETQVLFVEALAMVVGKSHPYAKKRAALTLREFESETLVLLNEEFATRHYIDRYCRKHGVVPRIAMEVNSITAGDRDRAPQHACNAAARRDCARAQQTMSGRPGAGAAPADRCVAGTQMRVSKRRGTRVHRARA